MKKLVVLIVVFVLLVISGATVLSLHKTETSPTIPPSPTVAQPTPIAANCKTTDLLATIESEGAAGSIYGKLSIKNTSTTLCQITGNGYISPLFTAKNITVSPQGQAGTNALVLSPNQTVYSQVRYPNGPQCDGPTKQSTISFNYDISATDAVTFKAGDGKTLETIQTCVSSTKLTDVQVWSLSTKPVNQ